MTKQTQGRLVRSGHGTAVVTKGPANVDMRYQVDRETFAGGEFVAEWRRLRGQG